MLLAAVGVTAAVMIYVRPRDGGGRLTVTSESKGGGAATPQSAALSDVPRGDPTEAPSGDTVGRVPGPLTAEETHSGPGRVRPVKKPSAVRVAKGDGRVFTPGAAEPAPERLIQEAERKYLSAIAALSRDVDRRRPRMDSETMSRFERTLAVVDRAIVETRAAARRHPRDPVVVQYMMAAYAKKVDLLRGMAQD
jgi:hypothetical protein